MQQMPSAEEFQALQQALAEAARRNEALAGELRVVRTERDLLQEQLNRFKRQLFAAKSEVRGTEQKDLFFNEAEGLGAGAAPAAEERSAQDDDSVDVPAHKRAKRGRKPLDPALPREVVCHELPEAERVCPHDGAALQEIGVETSEQLDIIPQQVRVIRHERVKYACPCCDGGLRLAPKPAQVIPKGLFTEGLLSWVITSKYLDGLPLYRQAALLGRFGGTDMSRNTAGCQRRACRPGSTASHQPHARPAAGGAANLRRRDRDLGAQGARAQGADQELHVGADDRGVGRRRYWTTDPAVRLLTVT
jgi:transposase